MSNGVMAQKYLPGWLKGFRLRGRRIAYERFERLERFELLLSAVCYRQAAQARSSQPKRKATPPMGVIAPSQRIPVKLRM